jgi:hypothetical protein
MAWEWVAPVTTGIVGIAGVTFTWLTGYQARKQTEAMTRRQEEKIERTRMTEEQRSAYFAALELASIELRRARYAREGKDDKLAEVEQKWPKRERVHMSMQSRTRIEVFGSKASREFVRRWDHATDEEDEESLKRIYEEGLALVRRELGIELFEAGDGLALTTDQTPTKQISPEG